MPVPRPQPTASPLPAHELAQLIELAREGDVAAFERLIAEHQAKVYSFAFTFVGDADRAKDLAQEALVKIYRSLHLFRFQSAFSTWLYAIVKNAYLDAVKSRGAKERALEDPLTADQSAHLRSVADAETLLLKREERALLERALRRVPADFRVVVQLADVQGLGYDQIAQILDLPIGTVKSRLKRGRDALRREIYQEKR
jgi:RNA polymerase sigma-70 factor (ECF subfamily)